MDDRHRGVLEVKVETATLFVHSYSLKGDYFALESDAFILNPWDYWVLENGRLVVHPGYQEELRELRKEAEG